MGQRTAILLKKNYGNNRSTITLIHHQWGIGKVMPSLFIQEVLKVSYPMDRSLSYLDRRKLEQEKKLPIDYFFTFEPLSNPDNNYITNKEVKTDDINEDIWRPEVRVRYGDQTDNNNGLMLVEVTQNYDSNGDARTYGSMFTIKVGFALGNEETYYWNNHLKESIQIEPDFVRLVSMEEYALRTFGNNDKCNKYTKKFVKACKTIMELEDVEEVYEKGGKEKRDEYEKHVRTCIEELTKDLPDKEMIEVPLEFKQPQILYK